MPEPLRCVITIMAHKKSGVWKKPWFSVTWALIGKGHAASMPFQDASDIPKYVDEAKRIVSKGRIAPPVFEILRVKEDPSLSFYSEREDERRVDWKKIFRC